MKDIFQPRKVKEREKESEEKYRNAELVFVEFIKGIKKLDFNSLKLPFHWLEELKKNKTYIFTNENKNIFCWDKQYNIIKIPDDLLKKLCEKLGLNLEEDELETMIFVSEMFEKYLK